MGMETPSGLLVNAAAKLPVGFRFRPKDEELLVHYLTRKAFGLPLPSLFIPDCDFFDRHPRDLPGDAEKEKHRYFFSRKQTNVIHGCRYWLPIGEERVVDPASNLIVGIRRTLVSKEAKKSCRNGTKTMWIMHEFCLPPTIQVCRMREVEWAVYHVFHKKIKKANINTGESESDTNPTEEESVKPDYIDLTGQHSSEGDPPPPPPISP